jgi:hypothetical protein
VAVKIAWMSAKAGAVPPVVAVVDEVGVPVVPVGSSVVPVVWSVVPVVVIVIVVVPGAVVAWVALAVSSSSPGGQAVRVSARERTDADVSSDRNVIRASSSKRREVASSDCGARARGEIGEDRSVRRVFVLALVLAGCTSDELAPSFAEPDLEASDPPLPEYDGEPLPAVQVGEWQYVEFADARCRDGSPAGVGVRYGSSDDLVIFFEGGGTCFNGLTCFANPSRFTAEEFGDWAAGSRERGIFARRDDNPVADWSAIYVPCCTGGSRIYSRGGPSTSARGAQRDRYG